ncbi:50S ribosomal protein L29 [Patescibacteria group bacterium]|nr:50S ribosomal protein L29 [Patescibacteria group bacterium]
MIKKTDKTAYRQKTIKQLEADLLVIRKKLVEDRMKLSLGQGKDTSVIKKSKYKIAFISTLIKENKSQKNNDNKKTKQ